MDNKKHVAAGLAILIIFAVIAVILFVTGNLRWGLIACVIAVAGLLFLVGLRRDRNDY